MLGFDDQTRSAEYKYAPKLVFSLRNNILSGITFPMWAKILRRHGLCIELKYCFRAAFITALSLVNSLLAAIEDAYTPSSLIDSEPLPEDPVFIVGHPRTGTTLVHNLLSSDVTSFYYCDTFTAGFPSACIWVDKFKHMFSGLLDKTRPMDSMPLTFELPGEDELATNVLSGGASYYMPLIFMRQERDFRRYLDFRPDQGAVAGDEDEWSRAFLFLVRKLAFRERTSRPGAMQRRLLLKSPVHTARLPLLRRLFPRARFVYVHRHPFEVFQSAAHMADTTYWFCYLNTPSSAQVTEFILWQFERLWSAYSSAAYGIDGGTSGTCLASDVSEVAYEALVNCPLAELERLYTDLDLPFDRAHFHRQMLGLAAYKPNEHSLLPAHLMDIVHSRWRGYFEKYGYQYNTD